LRGELPSEKTMQLGPRLILLCAALAVTLGACSSGSGSAGSSGQAAGAADQSAGASGTSPQSGAYGGSQGSAGAGRRFGELLKSLDLTPEQTAQIRTIVADARKKSEGADRETRRANMRAAYTQIETTVLTPAQRTEFDKKLAALRAKYAQHTPAPQ
jgi:Spy/CpxP family protein refolding chaperone